jgi:predicted metal-dependent HD superfamily phosphohydrolase
MGVFIGPPWLESSYARAVTEVGASAARDEIDAAIERLLTRWSDPRRIFHNTRHLIDVLHRVDELSAGTHAPALVRLAAFYHGAVFEPQMLDLEWGGDLEPLRLPRGANWEDEAASSLLAWSELLRLGVPESAAERVANLIGAMQDLVPLPGDSDSMALIDASLGLLAVEPQRYKTYLAEVRQENAGVPLRDFLEARIATLDAVLARPKLFASLEALSWERRARDNIAAELVRNRKELLRLDIDAAVAARLREGETDDGGTFATTQ